MIEELKDGIENLILPSSQSSMPAIYGMAAAAEVRRLQPVSGQTTSQAKVRSADALRSGAVCSSWITVGAHSCSASQRRVRTGQVFCTC